MNIHLEPLPAKEITEQLIMADGEKLGTVKTMPTDKGGTRYHIILESRHGRNIYQGFGYTIDAAMRDAVNTSLVLRINEIAELDQLENLIWGDYETHE